MGDEEIPFQKKPSWIHRTHLNEAHQEVTNGGPAFGTTF